MLAADFVQKDFRYVHSKLDKAFAFFLRSYDIEFQNASDNQQKKPPGSVL